MKSMTIDIVEPDYWEPAYFKVDWYFDAYKTLVMSYCEMGTIR